MMNLEARSPNLSGFAEARGEAGECVVGAMTFEVGYDGGQVGFECIGVR